MSKAGMFVALSMIATGATTLATSYCSRINEKKEQERINSQISSMIDKTELELSFGNIKKITDVTTTKQNGELLIIINGEYNHQVNGKYNWSATYNVDKIDYQNIMSIKDLNEKMYYVCDYIFPVYEPINISHTESALELNY